MMKTLNRIVKYTVVIILLLFLWTVQTIHFFYRDLVTIGEGYVVDYDAGIVEGPIITDVEDYYRSQGMLIVKQNYPDKGHDNSIIGKGSPNENSLPGYRYWIINKEMSILYGPMSRNNFEEKCRELNLAAK